MIASEDIQQLTHRIATRFHPERVVLFGSYANGSPNEESDVDLLVIVEHKGSIAENASEIRLACHGGFPLDLLVYTRERLDARLAMGDTFLREVIEKGTPLYEADNR